MIGNLTADSLGNGMRLIFNELTDSEVEYFGVAINAGSRDERPGEYGLAHFVEHTIFKGTSTKSSRSIINCMESVGGELNAYTTKEETLVYSIFPKGNLNRAVSLIFNLLTDSIFPDDELDHEREVVADEINSCLDIPSEAIYDCFEEEFFEGSQLAHNILGSTDSLRTFDSRMCREWLRRCYRAGNMVGFYCGSGVTNAHRTISRHFNRLEQSSFSQQRVTPGSTGLFKSTRAIGSHQSHNIIGVATSGMYNPDRFVLALINNILGGPGMNSRLNVELRERRGLVYSVDSMITNYTDAGVISIYFGCDPEDTGRCNRLVFNELERIATHRIPDVALDRAKRQYLGQLTVSSAMTESRILAAARHMMFHNALPDSRLLAERIESITADDILRVASGITPEKWASLTFN